MNTERQTATPIQLPLPGIPSMALYWRPAQQEWQHLMGDLESEPFRRQQAQAKEQHVDMD